MRGKRIAAAIAAAGIAISLTACGAYDEANDHNAATPKTSTDINLLWERLKSPPNYATIIHTCFGVDGLYISQADGNVFVVPRDPMC